MKLWSVMVNTVASAATSAKERAARARAPQNVKHIAQMPRARQDNQLAIVAVGHGGLEPDNHLVSPHTREEKHREAACASAHHPNLIIRCCLQKGANNFSDF